MHADTHRISGKFPMSKGLPHVQRIAHGKTCGVSPAEDRFYVLVFYDISDAKKSRYLVKILKGYGTRVQKSVFEAQLRRAQIKELSSSIERLMTAEKYYNPTDMVQVLKISGGCEATVYGMHINQTSEDNLFF